MADVGKTCTGEHFYILVKKSDIVNLKKKKLIGDEFVKLNRNFFVYSLRHYFIDTKTEKQKEYVLKEYFDEIKSQQGILTEKIIVSDWNEVLGLKNDDDKPFLNERVMKFYNKEVGGNMNRVFICTFMGHNKIYKYANEILDLLKGQISYKNIIITTKKPKKADVIDNLDNVMLFMDDNENIKKKYYNYINYNYNNYSYIDYKSKIDEKAKDKFPPFYLYKHKEDHKIYIFNNENEKIDEKHINEDGELVSHPS